MKSEIKYRIGSTQRVFMVCGAILFDLLELILALLAIGIFLNRIITFLEYFIYILWFGINKVPFYKSKNLSRLGGTFFLEMIPIIGAGPGFTVGVLMTINQSRREDLENFNEKNVKRFEDAIVRVRQTNNPRSNRG
jgi:hypothetical protein